MAGHIFQVRCPIPRAEFEAVLEAAGWVKGKEPKNSFILRCLGVAPVKPGGWRGKKAKKGGQDNGQGTNVD